MPKTVNAALARKMSAGHQGAGNSSRALVRALRLAVAQSALASARLPVAVIGAKQTRKKQDAVVDGLEESWLILLCTAPDGRIACISLDSGFVSGIVQKQTVGEVLMDPPPPRALTDTDAAMVVPLIEDILVNAAKLADEPEDVARLSGYEFKSRAPTPRVASLALVADVYDAFELTTELEGGVRQGAISVLLPDTATVVGGSRSEKAKPEKTLAESAGVVRAELNAVICRLHLPLGDLTELQTGDVLPLADARIDAVEVTAINRTRASKGRLGRSGGLRAIRINELVQPLAAEVTVGDEFIEHTHGGNLPSNGGQEQMSAGNSDRPECEALNVVDNGEQKVNDVALASTDNIAKEISELAGLPAPNSTSEP
ncbi:MAG: FliM/FliN family flagellar motor switch protein [Ruegeria sp.]